MALTDITRSAILQAAAECDRLGRDLFLQRYGFGRARSYLLLIDGKEYDSDNPPTRRCGVSFPLP